MKKLVFSVAFTLATVFGFAGNKSVNLLDPGCWWETYILDDGSEIDGYACSSEEHYQHHLEALDE